MSQVYQSGYLALYLKPYDSLFWLRPFLVSLLLVVTVAIFYSEKVQAFTVIFLSSLVAGLASAVFHRKYNASCMEELNREQYMTAWLGVKKAYYAS